MRPAAPSSQRPPRRAGPPLLGLAAALACLAATPHAHAAPTIEWHAPAGCPDEASVRAHILRVVGPDPLAAADALLRVQARVRPHGDAWLLTVVFTGRDATRERRLTLQDCGSTVDATALLVAIAVAGTLPAASNPRELPPALAIESPGHDAPAPTTNIPPAPPPTTTNIAPSPAPITTTPARPRLQLTAGPALAVGVLPRATPGLLVGLGVGWPRLRLGLAYTRWFRSPARLESRPGQGVDLSLHLASARIGPVRQFGPVALHAQLGLEFGALRAQGIGSDLTFDRRSWWGATLLAGALAWAPRALAGRGALVVQAELVIPLHRPTFTLGPDRPIFRLGPLGLRTALLLEARLF